jgi:alcohol dehydrogenase
VWARKQATWKKLGTEWKLENLDDLVEEISLEQVPESLEKLKQGAVVGRYLVNLQ